MSAFAFQVAGLGGFNTLFRRTVPQSTCYLSVLRYATLCGKLRTPLEVTCQPCFGVFTVREAGEDTSIISSFTTGASGDYPPALYLDGAGVSLHLPPTTSPTYWLGAICRRRIGKPEPAGVYGHRCATLSPSRFRLVPWWGVLSCVGWGSPFLVSPHHGESGSGWSHYPFRTFAARFWRRRVVVRFNLCKGALVLMPLCWVLTPGTLVTVHRRHSFRYFHALLAKNTGMPTATFLRLHKSSTSG